MAFDRVVSLIIGTGQEQLVQTEGLELNNLDLSFDIVRSRTFEENTAEFIVYNLSRETRNTILRKGSALIFSAGYKDEGTGTIFIGAVSDSNTIAEGGDIKTTINAVSGSGDNSLDTIYISLGFSKGAIVSEVLDEIAASMNLVIYGREQANIKLNNGFFYSGSAREALKRIGFFLLDNNVKMMVDNGEIVLFNIDGTDSRFDVGILDYKSGLLSAQPIISDSPSEIEDKAKIEVHSLLLPQAKPNGLLKIVSNQIEGFYIIEKVQFTGSNFGDVFDCKMELTE